MGTTHEADARPETLRIARDGRGIVTVKLARAAKHNAKNATMIGEQTSPDRATRIEESSQRANMLQELDNLPARRLTS